MATGTATEFYLHTSCAEENDPSVAAHWMNRRRVVARFFQEAFATTVGRVVVCDIGAGEGFNTFYAVRRLAEQLIADGRLADVERLRASMVVTIDVSSEWPDRLREALHAQGVEGYRHLDADLALGIPLDDDSVDVAICTEVVEHFVDPTRLIRDAFRVLRPGGYLILTTPNQPSIPGLILHRAKANREALIDDADHSDGIMTYLHVSCHRSPWWERRLRETGFATVSFGDYRTIANPASADVVADRPFAHAARFGMSALASIAPGRIRRHLGGNVELLARKPSDSHS